MQNTPYRLLREFKDKAVTEYKGGPPMYQIYDSFVLLDSTGIQLQNAIDAFRHNSKVATTLKKLCRVHASIEVDPNMLGGQPHLKGLRLSVGDILSKLYIHGDTSKLREIYPDVSIEQIKEAIAFAQDFLEEMSVTS